MGQSLAFETTYPELPMPLGSTNEPLEFVEGLHRVRVWEVLVGWTFVVGVLAYATLVDGEALSSFQKAKKQEKMGEWEC